MKTMKLKKIPFKILKNKQFFAFSLKDSEKIFLGQFLKRRKEVWFSPFPLSLEDEEKFFQSIMISIRSNFFSPIYTHFKIRWENGEIKKIASVRLLPASISIENAFEIVLDEYAYEVERVKEFILDADSSTEKDIWRMKLQKIKYEKETFEKRMQFQLQKKYFETLLN